MGEAMRKFCVQFFVAAGLMLAGIAGFIQIVDPFYHYREPQEPFRAFQYMPVYQTAGVAKNFSYDSAIVGTSMTENFRVSWFEEMDMDTVKLSYSGARSSDVAAILEQVFLSDNTVRYILLDINDYQLTTLPAEVYTERPAYLYEEVWWKDGEYLFNNDVFWMSAGRALEAVTDNQPNPDDAYTWEDPALFSEENVKASCAAYTSGLKEQLASGTIAAYDGTQEKEWCRENLENVVSVIAAHPETEFVVFYPPYSILYWEQQLLSGRLYSILEIYYTAAEKLLSYDNVTVFYFQNEEGIITNLDYYRDICHHAPEINRYIFDCIKEGKNELTEENIGMYFEDMYRIAWEYPYENIWHEE